jgi:hypothetical protein
MQDQLRLALAAGLYIIAWLLLWMALGARSWTKRITCGALTIYTVVGVAALLTEELS